MVGIDRVLADMPFLRILLVAAGNHTTDHTSPQVLSVSTDRTLDRLKWVLLVPADRASVILPLVQTLEVEHVRANDDHSNLGIAHRLETNRAISVSCAKLVHQGAILRLRIFMGLLSFQNLSRVL